MLKACFTKTKKGNVFFEGMTLFYWLVVLIMFGIVGLMVFTDLNDDFQADPTNAQVAKDIVQEAYDQYPSMWDDIIITVFIGLWLFALISAYFIDTSPIFFVISIVLLILLLIFVVYLSNGAYDIFTDADFEPFYEQFPKTNFIFENLLVVIIFVGASVMLTLYARK